jgi:single-stranded-DNA-specific exonuclease
MRGAIWDHLDCEAASVEVLSRALQLHPVVARLLCLRGLDTPEAADRFLNPSLDHLHDPRLLADMDVAVQRLLDAIGRQERIVVHGDYDVDGVTSTVILRRVLELLGANVAHFVPERMRDGYGLQTATLERLHAEGARIVVSVDCGIRADEAARRAAALGLDLIITDHHEPGTELPPAFAVINPKRADCDYPDKNLAGVGVALKIVQELCRRSGRTSWLPAFVKVAAIGTLADVVPLSGENRVISKLGLAALSSGRHTTGLRALLDASGLTGKQLDGFHVSYVLAPRVNAAGRMSTPDLATRLLLITGDEMADEAMALAEQLNAENVRRQQEEADVLAQALEVVEADPALAERRVLVVEGARWHRGVIGIVASRLVDRFCRPAIVLSTDEGVAHGSCRSVPAFDLLDGLDHCRELFDRYGGHRQAAGLTMDASRVDAFRSRLDAYARARLQPEDLRPRLRIDADLDLHEIDDRLVGGLARLGPFGAGNPRPVFHARNVEVARGPRTIKERHIRMSLRQDGRVLQAMAWRAADAAPFFEANRAALDVAFSVEESEFRGERYVELHLSDARLPTGVPVVVP